MGAGVIQGHSRQHYELMMMLTEDTADRMGVTNRLDSQQSITAGARYLAWLREQLPAAVQEPDRTWMALAAYNLGRGHFNGAQQIAPRLKADPNSWFDMGSPLFIAIAITSSTVVSLNADLSFS